MKTSHVRSSHQSPDSEWVTFPGGELQGKRPSVLCGTCRERVHHAANTRGKPRASTPLLCFACHRATVERERALKAAGALETASPERFQCLLPLEPVNRSRLAQLRVERAAVRVAAHAGVGRFTDKRRQAQIAARHALQCVVEGLRARNAAAGDRQRAVSDALHAAEMQLPESWLPFVAAR